MSPEGSSNEPAPRKYRPTYTKLPSSISTSNFGSPFPRPTAQTAPDARRRRTASVFPSTDHLHSAPTVAASGFTASVSSNDISHPTPKPHRLSIRPITRTPTRIPTPVPRSHIFSPVRSVSSPAVPKKYKENVVPTTHRLLGPIMPGPAPQSALTKSRTMNVLSSITSTFSRSTNSLTTSRSSSNNLFLQSKSPTTSYIPVPVSTAATITNIRQITAAMPTAYWLGRYQALHDRFRSDFLDPESLASPKRRAYWTSSTANSDDMKSSQLSASSTSDDEDNNHEQTTCSKAEERLSKRVFTHLDALCITPEARKSLKAFQQAYARRFASEALLPLGGSLFDEKGERVQIGSTIIAKAGRLFSAGARKGGAGSSPGNGSFGGVMRPRKKSGFFVGGSGGGAGFVGGSAGGFGASSGRRV